MVKFTPESIDSLKARFREALINSYSADKIKDNLQERPGSMPKHVFDFEDGIRLIVSRDIAGSQEMIHFSASYIESIYKGPSDTSLMDLMIYKFIILYGGRPDIKFVGFSSKGVPHWCIKTLNLN